MDLVNDTSYEWNYYYTFVFRDDLPESAYKYQLLGLNLLRLLAQNKLADFHTVSIHYIHVYIMKLIRFKPIIGI